MFLIVSLCRAATGVRGMGEWHCGPRLRGRGIWSWSQVPFPWHRSQTGRRPGQAAAARHLEVKCPPPSASLDTAVSRPSVRCPMLLLAARRHYSSLQSNHWLAWLQLRPNDCRRGLDESLSRMCTKDLDLLQSSATWLFSKSNEIPGVHVRRWSKCLNMSMQLP